MVRPLYAVVKNIHKNIHLCVMGCCYRIIRGEGGSILQCD